MPAPTPEAIDAAAHGVYTANRNTYLTSYPADTVPTSEELDDTARGSYRDMASTMLTAAYPQLVVDITAWLEETRGAAG